ncbi:hypothetical protein [Lolliginicoccus levis]|uniref:hypothetical protein n=1 Tax=Lolliginicoccus levis TaxID=2919542 RepID=UPI00241F1733|nr:hypothetical protein [Lolliginicoccus levis]
MGTSARTSMIALAVLVAQPLLAACGSDDAADDGSAGDSSGSASATEETIATEDWLTRYCGPFVALTDAFEYYDVVVAEPPAEVEQARQTYLDLYVHLRTVLADSAVSFRELGDPPVDDIPPGLAEHLSNSTQQAADEVDALRASLDEMEPGDPVAMSEFTERIEGTPNPITGAFADLERYQSDELDAVIEDVPACQPLVAPEDPPAEDPPAEEPPAEDPAATPAEEPGEEPAEAPAEPGE